MIYSYIHENSWTSHNYEVIHYELNGNSCLEGYTETVKCKDCAYVTTQTGNMHERKLAVEYDLESYGACPGLKVTLRQCYCGENGEIPLDFMNDVCDERYDSDTYVDAQGVKHDVSIRTCKKCAVVVREDSVRQDIGNCIADVNRTITVSVGNTLVFTFNENYRADNHDWEYSYALEDGAENCKDGIVVTEYCTKCGYSHSYVNNYHATQEVQGTRIDLTQYGSNCGAYLVQKQCPCGEYNRYEVVGDCDLGYHDITPWLGQYYEQQETTEGWKSPAYRAYDVKCAVTNPSCGLYIRKCEYAVYDEDTCMMTEYEVWQLGYDVATGKCEKELVLETGSYAYHMYEQESYQEVKLEDGGIKDIRTMICACGSKEVETSIHNAQNEWIYFSDEMYNMLADVNGENSYYIAYQDMTRYAGQDYITLHYNEKVSADGKSTRWEKSEYTYDWDNFDCTCKAIWTNSEGRYDVQEGYECHKGGYIAGPGQISSCTQSVTYYYGCQVCNKIDKDDHYTNGPWGHYYINGVCTRCGLESVNEADGSIVLEDMSAAYGNGSNYVIGFWNRNDIDFINNITIVNGEEETLLTGINFKVLTKDVDGINAISISQAEVEAAMKAAGVTGDVRIVFVPTGGGTDLDYAITLTK